MRADPAPQRYVETISKPHCCVVSTSDFLFGREYTPAQITRALIATPIGGDCHKSVYNVWVHTPEAYEAYMEAHRILIEAASRSFQAAAMLTMRK